LRSSPEEYLRLENLWMSARRQKNLMRPISPKMFFAIGKLSPQTTLEFAGASQIDLAMHGTKFRRTPHTAIRSRQI